MATYSTFTVATNLFAAYNTKAKPVLLSTRLLYNNATEFGYSNADGSKTYVKGEGFVYDSLTGQMTAGTITSISHYDANGAFIDGLTGIDGAFDAAGFQSQIEQTTINDPNVLRDYLLQGDDILDGRFNGGDGLTGCTLDGLGGNDIVRGSRAADLLSGSSGDDRLFGNGGGDQLYGGFDHDTIHGGDGRDRLYGGEGHDKLKGGEQADLMIGGAGNDVLHGGTGIDTAIYYGAFREFQLEQTSRGWRVAGPDGVDRLVQVERLAFDDGIHRWSAGEGQWMLVSGRPGQALLGNRINGTTGDDTGLTGTGGDDVIDGRDGNDVIYAGGGTDLVFGGAGNDDVSTAYNDSHVADLRAYGGDGDDRLGGISPGVSASATGADRLYGEAGDDMLSGYNGNDHLSGGSGADDLRGGSGADTLRGGGGADVFVFRVIHNTVSHQFETWGNDTIADFTVGRDLIDATDQFGRVMGYANNADGNAVIALDAGNSITLIGVDATVTALAELLV